MSWNAEKEFSPLLRHPPSRGDDRMSEISAPADPVGRNRQAHPKHGFQFGRGTNSPSLLMVILAATVVWNLLGETATVRVVDSATDLPKATGPTVKATLANPRTHYDSRTMIRRGNQRIRGCHFQRKTRPRKRQWWDDTLLLPIRRAGGHDLQPHSGYW